VVLYTDYGNEEEQNLSDLLTEASDLDEDTQKTADGSCGVCHCYQLDTVVV